MKESKIRYSVFFGIFLVILTSLTNSFGQEFRGTVTGTVSDPNGAAVAGATVVVKNAATNVSQTVTTNEEGSYTVPFLLPGKYSISVTNEGFKTSTQENVNLNVDDRLTIDFRMEIGSTTEVNIVADTELIERGSVTTGTVISTRQVEELPLPEGAVLTLVTQAPGVAYTGNPQFTGPTANGNLAAFRSNGAGGNQINLDGSPNFAFSGQVAFTPPSEAVQEFKVQTNSFDAQNGFTAGSTVNVALKSGTNKLHGAIYYYDRDKSRTANNFFSNRAGIERPDRKYYRYGATVSGPVFIPKLLDGRNRTFFLFSYEKQKDNVAEPTTFLVPTARQRMGDFSELAGTVIYNPATAFSGATCNANSTIVCRLPFTGNIIPQAQIKSYAQTFLNLFPLPNLPIVNGVGQYFSNMNLVRPYKSYLGRIDHNINNNNKIFGKFYYSRSEEDRYNWIGTPDAVTRGFEFRTNKGGNIDYTATLSSNLILDVRASYNQFKQERRQANPLSAADLGFPAAAVADFGNATVFPRFDFVSFTANTAFNTLGSNRADYNEGLVRPFDMFSFQPTMTQIFGNHTFRYGYDLRISGEKSATNGFNAGRFFFDGTYTNQRSNDAASTRSVYGRDLAAFLLGIPTANANSLIDNPTEYDVSSKYQGFFFQDDWRINQRLTINLGLRYELEGGVVESKGRIVTGFDKINANPLRTQALANYNASVPASVPVDPFQNLSGGLLFAASSNDPNQKADKNNIQPRIGISYSINDKTVVRGGFGIFTGPFQIQAVNQAGFSTPTLFIPSTNNGTTFISTLDNPFPNGVLPSPGSSLGLGTFIGRDLTVLSNERENPQFARFIVGIQRELPYGFGIEATYINSRGYNLTVNNSINNVPAASLNSTQSFDSTINTFLNATVANPFRGLVPDNATYNAATIARRRLLVPFPQFQNVTVTDYNGSSSYNSIQFQIVKRFTKGLSLNGSYSYSREREKTQYLNPQDTELTEDVSATDRPHRWTFSTIYELPVGRGRAFGKDWNHWLDALIGGWQFQANYEWQSGEPLIPGNVYFNGDPGSLKNLTGKKNSAGLRYGIDIPAFDLSGFYFHDATVQTNGVDDPAKQRADARIGLGNNLQLQSTNTLRYIPLALDNFRNQRFLNFNLGLSKNFRIRESMKIQLRVEAINIMNNPYFNVVNINPTSSGFGFTNGQRQPPRDIQIGARFTF